eukprot:TRINITY_DN69438_c0_g1_i1.p1 TRINITY_DN69438_c0_g1~~TRINITY_DN69438_c0_g1_i1.p1  ORF type:complete len:158 (+),score=26.18 TRINITY_DN69438_c0_g1_i1:43-474(+)
MDGSETLDAGTAFLKSCFDGNLDEVQAMLTAGASAGVSDPETGAFPLYFASSRGHLAVAEVLLDRGVDVDQTDRVGSTALHAACFTGHLDLVRLLLDKSASVNRESLQGATPLKLAYAKKAASVEELLLERGALDSDGGRKDE